MERGTPHVGVDHQRPEVLLRERNGIIGAAKTFSLAGQRAREKRNLPLGLGPEQGERRAQGAEGFGYDGIGIARHDEGRVLGQVLELGNGRNGRQPEDFLGLIHGLHRRIQIHQNQDDPETRSESQDDAGGNRAGLVRPDGRGVKGGGLDDLDGIRLDALAQVGLLHSLEDRFEEGAIGFEIALEFLVANRLLGKFEGASLLLAESGFETALLGTRFFKFALHLRGQLEHILAHV